MPSHNSINAGIGSGDLTISKDAALLTHRAKIKPAAMLRAFQWLLLSHTRGEREFTCLHLYKGLSIEAVAKRLNLPLGRAQDIANSLAARERIVLEIVGRLEAMQSVEGRRFKPQVSLE